MVKPFHILLTLLAVAVLCAATMFFFPKEGIPITKTITLKFASFDDFTEQDTIVKINVDSLLESYERVESIDSTAIKDSISRFQIREKKKLLNLQFANGSKHLLNFYSALKGLQDGTRKKIRVIHYGDSQIEGDRITSFVREKLQAEFGGTGPGMLPMMQFIPNISINHEQSNNWLRYTVFGRKDTTITHNHFGLRGIISRFTPYVHDSSWAQKEPTNAWVQLKPSRLGYGHVKHYRKMRIHYGYNKADVVMTVKVNDEILFVDTLSAIDHSAIYEHVFERTPQKLELTFLGIDSPDFYAISLEGTTGIVVDNVAMRGSSGTIFTKIDRKQLQYQFNSEPIDLVLLQYGGNTVPYIKSKERAQEYGRWFAAQIRYLQSMLPHADFVLIGPSDMAIKDKTDYVTRPFLVEVRDALKQAAFDRGIAFWDIYEVMGGRNSMASWVEADPPLAGPDYVHFTPRGARRMAELFYKALDRDYENYKANVARQDSIANDTASDTAIIPINSIEINQ